MNNECVISARLAYALRDTIENTTSPTNPLRCVAYRRPVRIGMGDEPCLGRLASPASIDVSISAQPHFVAVRRFSSSFQFNTTEISVALFPPVLTGFVIKKRPSTGETSYGLPEIPRVGF
jgi:hypothetical protein